MPLRPLLAVSFCVLAVSAPAAAAPALRPPVLHESFTRLPCPKKQISTLDIEACFEQQILGSDAKINALAKTIFRRLDAPARSRFVAGERAWLAYRGAFCQSQSDLYEGGTAAGIVDASCAASVNGQHVKDLAAFARALARH